VEDGSQEMDGGREMNGRDIRANVTKPRQTSILSNVEPEAKPVVVVVSRGGEARRQKRRLGGRKVVQDLLGLVKKNENEEQMLDIHKRDVFGGSKSQTPIERRVVAIETIEKTPEELHEARKMAQSWIWMR
jgi:hypothetical protein